LILGLLRINANRRGVAEERMRAGVAYDVNRG
jgi:hypothetical protein